MQRENKWQDRFDEKFFTKSKCCNSDVRKILSKNNNDLYCKSCGRYCKEIEKTKADELKSFIQSEINTAIAEERDRIVKEIYSEEWFELNSGADYIVNEIINKDK